MAEKDSDPSGVTTPEDKEAVVKLVMAWKVVKPYLAANHPEFPRTLPGQFGWYKDDDLNPSADKSELCWSSQVTGVLDFFCELTQGVRDVKGHLVKGGKWLVSGHTYRRS